MTASSWGHARCACHRLWFDANVFTLSSVWNAEKCSQFLAVLCKALPKASNHNKMRVCRIQAQTSQVPSSASLALCHQCANFFLSWSILISILACWNYLNCRGRLYAMASGTICHNVVQSAWWSVSLGTQFMFSPPQLSHITWLFTLASTMNSLQVAANNTAFRVKTSVARETVDQNLRIFCPL